MLIDSKFQNLFAADNYGFIYSWNINGYAVKKETQPPKCMHFQFYFHF
jgi:hypothetical protein